MNSAQIDAAAAMGRVAPSVEDAPGNALLEAALKYAVLGWAIFPVHSVLTTGGCTCGNNDCSSHGKHPRTTHGLHDATTNEELIRRFWNDWPDANIGIRTGEVSGLVVLDVDTYQGGDASLEELQREHGALPPTLTVKTGGGGWHYYFRSAPGIRASNTTNLHGLPGLDVRAEGGYVVAPPSRHRSGERYEFQVDPADWASRLPDAPSVLTTKRMARVEDAAQLQLITDGARNDTLMRKAGAMRRVGLSERAILAALETTNAETVRPPLAREELERIAASAAKYSPAASSSGPQVADVLPPHRSRSWAELAATVHATTEPLVVGLLDRGERLLIFGAPDSTKSLFTQELALAIHRGAPFLGVYATTKARVGIVDEEVEPSQLARRLEKIARAHSVDLTGEDLPLLVIADGARLDSEVATQRLVDWLTAENIEVVVFDSLRPLIGGLGEDKADDMSIVFNRLKDIQRAVREHTGRQLAVVLIHHTGKSRGGYVAPATQARGSTHIMAAVDSALFLKRNRNGGPVVAEMVKVRNRAERPRFSVMVEDDGVGLRLTHSVAPAEQSLLGEQLEVFIKNLLADVPSLRLKRQAIISSAKETLKASEKSVANALSRLVASGVVKKTQDGREMLYTLIQPGGPTA